MLAFSILSVTLHLTHWLNTQLVVPSVASNEEMKKIKQTKGGLKSLFVLGTRVLDSDDNCNVYEGATKSGGRFIGKYYASSGFFSKEGYLNPNFNKIEKESLGGNKSAYTLSGEYENFSFVRKIIIEENLEKKANIEFLPMQLGDVQESFADIEQSVELLDYKPTTNVDEGIKKFIDWYQHHYIESK